MAHPDDRTRFSGSSLSTGTPQERLRACLEYAILAPSGHNTQPWLFRIEDQRVYVHADVRRRLPVCDPHDRELTISVGAAVFALRLAMRRHGLKERTLLCETPRADHLLAVVEEDGPATPIDQDRILFKALPHRRTNRMEFRSEPIPDQLLAKLAMDVKAEGAAVEWASDARAKHAVAKLIHAGVEHQFRNAAFRRELASWIRPNKAAHHDGLSACSGDSSHTGAIWDMLSYLGPLAVRSFVSTQHEAHRLEVLADHSPHLMVIFTPGDTPLDWLRAGQAVMRMTLHAASCGVSAGYLGQPVQDPQLRRELAKLFPPAGVPQLLLRMGYGPEVPPSPRRPLAEFIIDAGFFSAKERRAGA